MKRDTLFVLPPGFVDNGRREFCPECAELTGLLACFPFIRDALDIVHVDIDHPRQPIVALLGEGRYNAPTLVLTGPDRGTGSAPTKSANGHVYLDSMRDIAALFAHRYGIPARRGS